jgi:hypothetical protein
MLRSDYASKKFGATERRLLSPPDAPLGIVLRRALCYRTNLIASFSFWTTPSGNGA